METQAYMYESGVLLGQDHPEFNSWNSFWNEKYGFFNENWGVIKAEEKELDRLKDCLLGKLQHRENNSYTVIEFIGTIDYEDEAEWNEKDFCGKYDLSVTGKMKNVVWSAAKIDGEIVENFLKK